MDRDEDVGDGPERDDVRFSLAERFQLAGFLHMADYVGRCRFGSVFSAASICFSACSSLLRGQAKLIL